MSETRRPFAYVTKAGKAVRSEFLDQYAIKSGSDDESNQLSEADQFATSYSGNGLIQPLYNPAVLSNLLEMNTYHMRCVRTKARDTAGLGWDIQITVQDPGDDLKSQRDAIIKAFNDMPESLTEVLYRSCHDWEAVSYGVLEVCRVAHDPIGDFASINHMRSPEVRVHREGNKYAQMVGNKIRWFKKFGYPFDVDMNSGLEFPLGGVESETRATELLFWTNYSSRSSFYGLPDIMPALGAIHGDISRRDYNISFFDNYGVPAYAVFVSGNFDPGEPKNDAGEPDVNGRTDIERMIEDHFQELANNPHSVLILTLPSDPQAEGDVKIEFQALATQVRDASFRLYRQDNRDEVLAAHGVPLNRLGINETGALAGSTAIESTQVYKSSVIAPRQDSLETLINRSIIWGLFDAPNMRFQLAPIDTSDESHDVEMAKVLFLMGVFTPNDLIKAFGERFGLTVIDHPAMNAHYVNGAPIDYVFVDTPTGNNPAGDNPNLQDAPPPSNSAVGQTIAQKPVNSPAPKSVVDEVLSNLQSLQDIFISAALKVEGGDNDEFLEAIKRVRQGVTADVSS